MSNARHTPVYFAAFNGYIVTANQDGSVPLNSKIAAESRLEYLESANILLHQANTQPDLLAALEAVIANGPDSAPGLGAYLNARAAIAKAKGEQ